MATSRKRREKRREKVSARERLEKHTTGFERTMFDAGRDATYFKLEKTGVRRIDVIDYVVGEGNPIADPGKLYYERTFFAHRGIGVNQKDWYVCPAKTAGKPCPICEYRARLAGNPDADEEEIKGLAPKERQLWNVIDLDNKEAGVQVWEISFHLFGKLLDSEIETADEDEPYEFFSDLEEGMSLKLGVREKKLQANTYCEVETIGFKPRRNQYDDSILEQTCNLDDALIILEYDKLKAIFLQTEEADKPDGDEDKEPAKKPRKRRAKKEKQEPVDDTPTAESVGIEEGDPVVYEDNAYEVARISKDGTSLTLEDSDGDLVKAVGVEEVKKVDKESSKPKSKSKPDTVDDDEGSDDNWDEEPDEKAPPKKKSKSKSKAKPAKDEDDDNWDDFDDD